MHRLIDTGLGRKGCTCSALLLSWISVMSETLAPPNPRRLIAAAQALLTHAHFAEADDVLHMALERFAGNRDVIVAYAKSAHSARNWPEAVKRFTDAIALFPTDATLYVHLVNTLITMKRLNQAELAIDRAADHIPEHPAILSARARVALARKDAALAIDLWSRFREKQPSSAEGYTGAASALRAAGRADEAEALLERVREQFENHPPFLYHWALSATTRRDWQAAFDRWADLCQRFPATDLVDKGIGDMLTLWRLACMEHEADALAVSVPDELKPSVGLPVPQNSAAPANTLSDQALMMSFDSLGDRCEFGLVQRYFGAEPLSLLRWSQIAPNALVALLSSRFDGVGNEEHAYVMVIGDEYFAGDRRYFFMHTFTKVHEMTEARMLKTATTRMRFLKDKLLEDLDAWDKIFVYKRQGTAISADEERAIAEAMTTHYPKAALLLVRKADDPKNAGVVENRAPNVYAAFLDKIDLGREHISYGVWNTICRRVYADWILRRVRQA